MNNSFVINPYSKEDLAQIIDFENKNNQVFLSKSIEETKTMMTEEEYKNLKRTSNTIIVDFCIKEGNKIKDICHIVGERDRKTCSIFLLPIKGKRKKIIEQVTNYVFNVLGMEQLFISTKPDDVNIIKTLEELEFISLGEESGNIIYLKDKEEEKEIGRRI